MLASSINKTGLNPEKLKRKEKVISAIRVHGRKRGETFGLPGTVSARLKKLNLRMTMIAQLKEEYRTVRIL
ncbi:hypothetical protein [Pueribacillus sp. YX66]|uniref:hypothetical protein n=1 Tax=Pueribacillus sp. YX66 TaxID=3229242 RepID=UPI00358D9206